MANNPFFSDPAESAALAARCALCNSGKLRIYDGSQPTDANTAVAAQTLLAELTFGNPAFGSPAPSGSAPSRVQVATANAITAAAAAATGTAAWFRCVKSDGTTGVLDGSAGVSGCDLNLLTTSIVSGESVPVTSLTISQPE